MIATPGITAICSEIYSSVDQFCYSLIVRAIARAHDRLAVIKAARCFTMDVSRINVLVRSTDFSLLLFRNWKCQEKFSGIGQHSAVNFTFEYFWNIL